MSCYLPPSESDSNTNRKSDDSRSIEGYIDSDSSSEYLPPAAKQRKRRYHDFTGHPTVSTELEEMEDFFCSPNSIAREGPRNKEKNEPTSFTDMNDFLTWIQKDRPLQAGTMCTYMDHLCSGLQFACSCTSCRHYTSKGWRCLVLSRNELLRQTR